MLHVWFPLLGTHLDLDLLNVYQYAWGVDTGGKLLARNFKFWTTHRRHLQGLPRHNVLALAGEFCCITRAEPGIIVSGHLCHAHPPPVATYSVNSQCNMISVHLILGPPGWRQSCTPTRMVSRAITLTIVSCAEPMPIVLLMLHVLSPELAASCFVRVFAHVPGLAKARPTTSTSGLGPGVQQACS